MLFDERISVSSCRVPNSSDLRPSFTAALLLVVAFSAWPRSSDAQALSYPPCSRKPTAADVAGAKGAFQAGQASFEEADYERAIDYWEDAYRRDCTAHALLLNLARAYELFGSKAQAVLALETYLERQPKSPDRGQIQRRLEVLNSQVRAEQAAILPVPETQEEPKPEIEPVAVAVAVAPPPKKELIAQETNFAPEKTSVLHEPDGPAVVPLVVAGVGGALAIAGSIVFLNARADERDAEKICSGVTCPMAQRDVIDAGNEAHRRGNIAGVVTLAGAALLGGGIAWYFLATDSRTPGAQLVPVAAPGYAGLGFIRPF